METLPPTKTYKSPRRKLIRFFEKSRDQWKTKHHQAKATAKRLANRVRFLEKSKERWKNRAIELETELARQQTREQALAKEIENLQKKTSPAR